MIATVTSNGSPVVPTVTNTGSPVSSLPTPDMQGIPYELRTMIFSLLSGEDALRASGVCSEWRTRIDNLSNSFLARDFQHPETEHPKELYRKFLRLNRHLSGNIHSTRTIIGSAPAERHCAKDSKLVLELSNNIQIWDLKTCRSEKTLPGSETLLQQMSTSLTLTDENKVIATDLPGTIKVWDLESGACEKTINSGQYCIQCLSADKGILVTGTMGGEIRVWNLEDGKYERTLFADPQTSITSLCLSQERDLISGSTDNKIRILDTETGHCKMTLDEHESRITFLHLTPRGDLISGSEDGTIKIWDLVEGASIKTLTGHESKIISLYPTKTGKLISCDRNTIKIWDLQSYDCEQTLVDLDVHSVSFTDEGKLIITQSAGYVTILDFMADKEEEKPLPPKSSNRCTLS
jgi:WD40 repeat protein